MDIHLTIPAITIPWAPIGAFLLGWLWCYLVNTPKAVSEGRETEKRSIIAGIKQAQFILARPATYPPEGYHAQHAAKVMAGEETYAMLGWPTEDDR